MSTVNVASFCVLCTVFLFIVQEIKIEMNDEYFLIPNQRRKMYTTATANNK